MGDVTVEVVQQRPVVEVDGDLAGRLHREVGVEDPVEGAQDRVGRQRAEACHRTGLFRTVPVAARLGRIQRLSSRQGITTAQPPSRTAMRCTCGTIARCFTDRWKAQPRSSERRPRSVTASLRNHRPPSSSLTPYDTHPESCSRNARNTSPTRPR